MGRFLQAQEPPPWLSSRILSNTPHVVRITWRDWAVSVWRGVCEPRFALALITSVFMLGWMGQLVGISSVVRTIQCQISRIDQLRENS